MLEYLEISWINAGSAWKTQKGCVALQLCSSGVLNLQGIPGSTCWSTTGVFVFNAGSHHTKGFDTSQQHHWRERQVASSVENSKSCPNKYHIYNSTCPKLKLDFWGFQMFPAFLSCLKLSLGCALALSGLRFVGTSKARNFFNWSVPALRSHSHSHMLEEKSRVSSCVEYRVAVFDVSFVPFVWQFDQFHSISSSLWIWNSNFSTRHRRFSGSLARWLVGASLLVSHAIGGYWPKVSSWPRLWCLMSFIDLIHSDSVNLLLYFPSRGSMFPQVFWFMLSYAF
jgi:hypothetical protein